MFRRQTCWNYKLSSRVCVTFSVIRSQISFRPDCSRLSGIQNGTPCTPICFWFILSRRTTPTGLWAHLCPFPWRSGGCADVAANEWTSFRQRSAREAGEGGGGQLRTFHNRRKPERLSTFECLRDENVTNKRLCSRNHFGTRSIN